VGIHGIVIPAMSGGDAAFPKLLWDLLFYIQLQPSHGVCKPAYLVPVPSQDKLGGLCQKGDPVYNGGMAEVGVPVSQDGVTVHPDCWYVCLCYLHFAPKNPEDGKQRYDIWVSPSGRSHMPMQTGGGVTQLERSTTLC